MIPRALVAGGLVTAVCALVPAPAASAQHADLVLFGDPDPAAVDLVGPRAVHPVTAPFFHEDSFITSDVRVWAIYHDFPKSSAIDGGNAKALAVQLRLALTDSLQLVAYKDGYLDLNTGLVDESGLFDIGAGIKWNFFRDWEQDLHLAAGVGYEMRSGNGKVLQNDDEWRFWFSANKGFERLHLGGTVNLFFADDSDSGLGNSDRLSWHLHADYWACDWFSPVVELNGYHVLDEGLAVLPFQGVDVANLGGGEDEDVITLGIGGEFRPSLESPMAIRAAYEFPLTHEDDLFGYRWTLSLVFSF